MHKILQALTKTATTALVAATIAWSIGLSALVAPLTARAAAPASGTIVKASLPAVYYVGADGKRYVFPNEKTYKTWYADFSSVLTITDAELAALPIGGNATYKPGSRMVKITTDPKVYAVDKGGALRWVKTEALAVSLYGASWAQMIDDVPDAFFTNYTSGADINSASDYSPAGVSSQATSINADRSLATSAATGPLAVSYAASNPAPATFVGGIGASMLEIAVKNVGTAPATVDSLTLKRVGNGKRSDFYGVYLFRGYDRITSVRTIGSTDEASFTGIGVTVAPGATEQISVIGSFNIDMGANDQHALRLTDLKSGSLQATGLPLTGPTFTMSTVNAGTVTVTKSGASPQPNVRAGGVSQKIGEFQLALDSVEAVDLASIALTLRGAVSREKISNLVLKTGGTAVATAAGYDKYDRATFVLDTMLHIDKGSSKTFEVLADIAPGTRGGATETIFTLLDDATDLTAYGATYGFGVTVVMQTAYAGSYDGASCALGSGNCSSTRVEAGQLTMTFNGPASKDVGANQKDVELFNFTMAAQSNLEVRKLQLLLDGNNDLDDTDNPLTPRVTDIKLVDAATGATVAGPKDSTNGTGYATLNNSSTLDFTETFALSAGQARTFKVTADIGNAANLDNNADGTIDLTTLKVTLKKFSALSSAIRNLDSNQDLGAGDYAPDSDIAGNTNNVKNPSLAITAASTPVAQTYIKGAQGAPLMGISLKAGDASAIKVTTLQLQGQIDSNDGTATCAATPQGTFANGQENAACSSFADVAQTLKLWNGSTQVSATKSPTSGTGGLVTFDNMNLTVPAGQTLTLLVTANLAAGLTTANLPDDIRFQLANAGVTATDPDGNAVTATGGTLTGPVMRVADAGAVTVSLAPDDTESEAGHLVGGSSNAVLAKYKLTAQNEELKLTKARMNVATASGVTGLSLYDGATLVGGPVSVDGSGNADFSGMNFVIPKDGAKNLVVKGALTAVGTGGAASGADVKVTFKDTAGTVEIRGTSAGSSTVITTIGGDKAARQKVVRRTKPTVSLVALPTTALSDAGGVVIARFTVSADAAENVSLKKLSFKASVSDTGANGAVASPALREVGQGSDLDTSSPGGVNVDAAGGTNCGFTSSQSQVCVRVVLKNEYVIAAGTSKTLELRVTTSGFGNSGDTLSTTLLGDATLATGELETAAPALAIDDYDGTANNGEYNFVWSDNSKVPHNDTVNANGNGTDGAGSNDWTSGLYVKVLPADPQTMTRT